MVNNEKHIYTNFVLEIADDFLPETQPNQRILGLVESYYKHKKVFAYTFLIKVWSNDFTIWYNCIDPEKIFHLRRAKGFYISIINQHSKSKEKTNGK